MHTGDCEAQSDSRNSITGAIKRPAPAPKPLEGAGGLVAGGKRVKLTDMEHPDENLESVFLEEGSSQKPSVVQTSIPIERKPVSDNIADQPLISETEDDTFRPIVENDNSPHFDEDDAAEQRRDFVTRSPSEGTSPQLSPRTSPVSRTSADDEDYSDAEESQSKQEKEESEEEFLQDDGDDYIMPWGEFLSEYVAFEEQALTAKNWNINFTPLQKIIKTIREGRIPVENEVVGKTVCSFLESGTEIICERLSGNSFSPSIDLNVRRCFHRIIRLLVEFLQKVNGSDEECNTDIFEDAEKTGAETLVEETPVEAVDTSQRMDHRRKLAEERARFLPSPVSAINALRFMCDEKRAFFTDTRAARMTHVPKYREYADSDRMAAYYEAPCVWTLENIELFGRLGGFGEFLSMFEVHTIVPVATIRVRTIDAFVVLARAGISLLVFVSRLGLLSFMQAHTGVILTGYGGFCIRCSGVTNISIERRVRAAFSPSSSRPPGKNERTRSENSQE